MPVASLLSISEWGICFQWFTESGKRRHENVLRWADIASVGIFKRDMFTYDLICIQLSASDNESVELDEDDPNWQDLMAALPQRLPGCRPWGDWFTEVSFPAFAANPTLIFERE